MIPSFACHHTVLIDDNLFIGLEELIANSIQAENFLCQFQYIQLLFKRERSWRASKDLFFFVTPFHI